MNVKDFNHPATSHPFGMLRGYENAHEKEEALAQNLLENSPGFFYL